MKIGIVGNGFVGNALYQNFKDKELTYVFDVIESKSKNSLKQVLECDIIFICLPTPMKDDGECDLSYIHSFFDSISSVSSLFVIKSTVPIGTTDLLCTKRNDLRIVHNPEFLTAVNAVDDFRNADRHIIGGRTEWCFELKAVFDKHTKGSVPIQITTSKESETIKYFSNCFLAAKVALFNNLYEICSKFDLDFDSVRHGVYSDNRIGISHTKVPGPDGKLGFGGYCFPKDINALISTLRSNNIDDSLFSTIWEYNKKIRGKA